MAKRGRPFQDDTHIGPKPPAPRCRWCHAPAIAQWTGNHWLTWPVPYCGCCLSPKERRAIERLARQEQALADAGLPLLPMEAPPAFGSADGLRRALERLTAPDDAEQASQLTA